MERTTAIKKSFYDTTELKLAALLLAEIPESGFEVYPQGNSSNKQTISISFKSEYKNNLEKLIADFINKQAITHVYDYNKALHLIRDKIRLDNKNERNR